MKKELFTLKGFWNGEGTATFTGCIIKPIESTDAKMMWWNVFAGQERQAIEVAYEGQTWIIDNNTGQAYEKLTIGMGSPSHGHKSLGKYEFVRYIERSELICQFNEEKEASELQAIRAHQKEKDPVEFERIQRIEESLRKYQRMTTNEKIDYINKNSKK